VYRVELTYREFPVSSTGFGFAVKVLFKLVTYYITRSRFLREVSPSSYLGRMQGLAGNSKSIVYEVC
jgi:hypothetical protein